MNINQHQKRREFVQQLIKQPYTVQQERAKAYAPANIALIKYWGKRDKVLNLPVTDSLSIPLGDRGSHTEISTFKSTPSAFDIISLNGVELPEDLGFHRRLSIFLDTVRVDNTQRFQINIKSTVPVAAGLASSAAGFAALVKALNELFAWELSLSEQSMLARLGSGSASRSLYNSFAYWHAGEQLNGLDSFAEPLAYQWSNLRIGIVLANNKEKAVASTAGMLHTQKTSPLYDAWPELVRKDMDALQTAIHKQDFELLGTIAEGNASAMHALMYSARPSLSYHTAETHQAIATVMQARADDVPVYYTQDAGPHIKLLFEAENEAQLHNYFPTLDVVNPWSNSI